MATSERRRSSEREKVISTTVVTATIAMRSRPRLRRALLIASATTEPIAPPTAMAIIRAPNPCAPAPRISSAKMGNMK